MGQRTCATPGCDKPHRARGLCSTHYNRTYAPDRHRTDKVCEACGTGYTTTRTNGRYCSLACRDAESRARKALVGPLPWVDAEPPPPTPDPDPRLWVSGPCAWCGTPFTARAFGDSPRFCTRLCGRRLERAARRALERGAPGRYTWAEVTRLWLAIGKACAYCATAVANADLQPDHVLPLSRGGGNSITNIVPCCAPCNREKGSLTLSEWAAKRAGAGLEPRAINPGLARVVTAA